MVKSEHLVYRFTIYFQVIYLTIFHYILPGPFPGKYISVFSVWHFLLQSGWRKKPRPSRKNVMIMKVRTAMVVGHALWKEQICWRLKRSRYAGDLKEYNSLYPKSCASSKSCLYWKAERCLILELVRSRFKSLLLLNQTFYKVQNHSGP